VSAVDADQIAPWISRSRLEAVPRRPFVVNESDPVLPSRHHVAEAAAVAIGLTGAVAADIHEVRTGQSQDVSLSLTSAALAVTSYQHNRLNGAPVPRQAPGNPTSSFYECGSGGWIHLQGALPHLRRGTLDLLDCADTMPAIAETLQRWDAFELEDELADRGLCGARARTWQEWVAHPQGAAVTTLPLVEIVKIGEAAPRVSRPGARPLDDIRVLDMTRILAGPMCGKTLAAHGAEVLNVSTPALPNIFNCVVDTGHGKRSCELDLRYAWDTRRLLDLADTCDVLINGYRSGGLEGRGFGPEVLARSRPGIVYVSINCYGPAGPWRDRRGWEQLAQTVTGTALAEGDGTTPRLMPGAPNDYITGYLAGYGAMAALHRQMTEGGSWWVRASLCQTAAWIAGGGSDLDPDTARGLPDEVARLTRPTEFGTLDYLAAPVSMSRTPPGWDLPPAPLGGHAGVWSSAPATVS
jgi:crotonobetainyl-CoA:carnitine CoA-transferase CaiB-like acyl-CoA transferase